MSKSNRPVTPEKVGNRKNTSLVPRLRFPEFGDGWEEKRLGEFIEEYRKISTKQDEFEVLTSARDGLVRQRDYYDNSRISERDNVGFNVIPTGYMTYRSRSDDRRFFFNENNLGVIGIISTYYPVFRMGEGCNKFFIELLSHFSVKVGKHSVGTSQTVLSLNELRKIELPIPKKEEQQKIADCLSSLDTLIAVQTEKIDALKTHKKGLMQQLFPQDGETVPRLRFSEFLEAGEWKKCKLAEIAAFHKGKGISKADVKVNGTQPCIRYGELYTIYGDVIDRVVSSTDVPTDDLFLSEAGDVIVPSSGETKIDIATAACVLRGGVALGGDLNVIRSEIDGVFLSYYLNGALKHEIAKVAQGDTVVHLYRGNLEALNLAVPLIEEQKKIAESLSSLEALITAEKEKIDALKSHKKGLVQQLFPSLEQSTV